MKKSIILASSSPRRKAILRGMGLEFKVMSSHVTEYFKRAMAPKKLVEKLAERKALDVAKRVKKGIVIGADTLLVCGKAKLGKPKDGKHAFKMLKRMSGRTLKVYSGVAIVDAETGRKAVDSEKSCITLRKLTDKEIRAYVKTKEPLGKAGSIAIQGKGARLISRVQGCRSNVIGLPACIVRKSLRKFGVST